MSDKDRDPEVQELLDKQAIHDVMVRYCRGLDRMDAELIGSVYHPDAHDDHGGRTFRGSDAGASILEWLRESRVEMGSHHDRLERRDGEWRISDRRIVAEMYRYLPADGDPATPHWHLETREDPDLSYALLGAQ